VNYIVEVRLDGELWARYGPLSEMVADQIADVIRTAVEPFKGSSEATVNVFALDRVESATEIVDSLVEELTERRADL
jgi:hypothetical protein